MPGPKLHTIFEPACKETVVGCVTTLVNTNYFEVELTTTGWKPPAKTNINTGNLVSLLGTDEETEKVARSRKRGGDIPTDSLIGDNTYEICERTTCNRLALTGIAFTH